MTDDDAMQSGKTLALLAEGVLWRVTHREAFGRRLLAGLGESDENARAMAGIMLAKGGTAAIPLLQRALAQRRHVAAALALLGDIGDPSVETDVAQFASDPDDAIAQAAKDALRVLALRQGRDSVPTPHRN